MTTRLVRTVVALWVLLTPLGAGGQDFGRNKVAYEDFEFRILATEHFDIYYYAQEERAARIAARLAERWYARFSSLLHHTFDGRQSLVLYGSQAEFAQTNVVHGLLPDSVGGVTEGLRRRMVMPFAPTLAETDRVIGHELVHAFQFDIARRHGGDTGQALWFIEGMAEYLSHGALEPDSSLWLRDAVLSGRLPEGVSAAARDLSPYKFGHAFWSYLGSRFGDDIVEKTLKPGRKQRGLKDRIRHATSEDLDVLYRDWRAAVIGEHAAAREGRDKFPIWSRDRTQIGPSVSPDGARAVFFSEHDRQTLDLFLADVRSGLVIRKLATTAASAKFDSLQPLRSAGAWSPDGRWFAFAAVRQGRAAIQLVDVGQGIGDREMLFPSVGQVLSPTWSPNGRSIAFAAIAGGWTDLYVTDVASGSLRQLTDDAVADFQPAWSHDGRSIAFVTERFSTDLSTLNIGRPQLAILDWRPTRRGAWIWVSLTPSCWRTRRGYAAQSAMVGRRSRSLLRRRCGRHGECPSRRSRIVRGTARDTRLHRCERHYAHGAGAVCVGRWLDGRVHRLQEHPSAAGRARSRRSRRQRACLRGSAFAPPGPRRDRH